jgi:pimeloyl-ACP methyl ester carboxylesterase
MAERVLYLLAGLMCDETVWAHQRDALADLADVRVMSFPEYDSLTDMARALLKQAPPRFAIAGHSMGGRVAMEVMRLAPERVERLALLNTARIRCAREKRSNVGRWSSWATPKAWWRSPSAGCR